MTEQILSAFATHERINQFLLENLTDEAWAALPPEGKGRTIRAIFAHIHNVRLMWLKAILKDDTLPPDADKTTATRADVAGALSGSYSMLVEVLQDALPKNKVRGFSPDAVSFFVYLVSHESHHRGQVMALARRLGYPLPKHVEFGIWEWGARSREVKSASA